MGEEVEKLVDRLKAGDRADMFWRYGDEVNVDYVLEQFAEAAERIEALEAALEALKGAQAWLDRWAEHVASCRGGDYCECGLTAIRSEVNHAVAVAEPPGTPIESASSTPESSGQVVATFDWRCSPPEIPSVDRVISYLRDYGPGTPDTTDCYMMRWAADHLANLDSRAKHWQRVAEALRNPPKHDYWGAGEPNCPKEIKAGNGELHTLRCKRCGLDSPRSQICIPGGAV